MLLITIKTTKETKIIDKQKLTELVVKAQHGDKDALKAPINDCYYDIFNFAFKTMAESGEKPL